MNNEFQTEPVTTYPYKADWTATILTDQILARRLTINWTQDVNWIANISNATNNLFHQGQYF